MRDDKPWCGRPLPLDADGWKTRAFAFKDALLETRQELAAATTRAEQAEQRAAALAIVVEGARREMFLASIHSDPTERFNHHQKVVEILAASGGAAPAEQAGGE